LFAVSLSATEHAPLPTVLLSAKTVYLLDASNDSAVFDHIYERLEKWGRWRVVADQKDADLVLTISDQNISYGAISSASAVASPGYAGATATSVPLLSFPRILTIFDRATGEQLFRVSCERRLRASYTAGVLVNRTRRRIERSE
jgi:hypothetical protein